MNLFKMKNDFYKYFTYKESLEAVKQTGYALRYVNESCLTTGDEMTLEDIYNELGKIIKKQKEVTK